MKSLKKSTIALMRAALAVMIGLVFLLMTSASVVSAFAAAGDSVSYTADFSDGVPSDWQLYDKSDVSNTTASAGNGTAVLTHSNDSIGAALYHGGVYMVGTELGDLSDFELKLTFRFVSYSNNTRWIGVYYHTRINDDGKMSGYLMNLRVNGNSAQSTVTSSPSYNDTENVASGAVLTDGSYHTMYIKCNDGVVEHYVDDVKVIEYELNSKIGILGGINTEGGFAIGVNRSVIEISSLEISGTQAEAASEESSTLCETTVATTRLVGAPTIVTRVQESADLEALASDESAATAILTIDGNLNVLGNGSSSLGTLDSVISEYLGKSVIPAINVTDQSSAEALIAWVKETNALDIAVVSSDLALLKTVRSAVPWVRGIADFSVLDGINCDDIVANATAAYAHIVILNESAATAENVRYLQARLKTVWLESSASTAFGIAAVISNGEFGIVTNSPAEAYEALKYYTQTNSLARVPFSVAHRGLCLTNYENSIEGTIAAYESGATHVEMDLQLTSDGHIVIMHDDTIDRTTNGSGSVSALTLEQLKRYKITKNYNGVVLGDGVEIPTLEEMYQAVADIDVVLILEIKTTDSLLVAKLKELTDEYSYMYGKIIVTSFYLDQLEDMKEIMPETPTAYLMSSFAYSDLNTALYTFGYYNTVFDAGYGGMGTYFLNALRDRGYMSFLWTYGSASDVIQYFASGAMGMSTNSAEVFADIPAAIEAEGKYVIASVDDGLDGNVEVIATSYDGTKTKVNATIFMYDERDGGIYVILKYRYTNSDGLTFTIYSGEYRLVYAELYMSPDELSARVAALPSDITMEYKAEVEALRAAYDMLDGEDRAEVANISTLVGAENTLARLADQEGSVGETDEGGGNSGESLDGIIIGVCVAVAVVVVAAAAVSIVVIKRRRKK